MISVDEYRALVAGEAGAVVLLLGDSIAAGALGPADDGAGGVMAGAVAEALHAAGSAAYGGTSHALCVLLHSENRDKAAEEGVGCEGRYGYEWGQMAYYAFRADVEEELKRRGIDPFGAALAAIAAERGVPGWGDDGDGGAGEAVDGDA